MCGDRHEPQRKAKAVNWRNIAISLIDLGTGVLSVNPDCAN